VTRAGAAWIAAAVLTAANAIKPIVVDDPIFVTYAQQAAHHPTDPYGFEFFWNERPGPAIRFGWVPPVLPYWLAAAMTLFGDQPFAWKLALFPFALALSAALAFVLTRFAPRSPPLLVLAIVLGPVVLPSLNLMLDVPAIALGLAGFALFVSACDRASPSRALVAGLLLGLAMQTKYVAVVYPALALVYALCFHKAREAVLAMLAAAALFIGWEAALLARYGESHFLAGVERLQTREILRTVARAEAEAPGTALLYWAISLPSLLGGTALASALLALVGLGARHRLVSFAAIAATIPFALIVALPRPPLWETGAFVSRLAARNPELFLFLPLGLACAAVFGAALWRLRRDAASDRRLDAVLVAWLVLEVAGYFAISPFPAVRRVIGLGIAMMVFAARIASLRPDEREARAGARAAALLSIALGALYFGSDVADARARREVAGRASARLAALGADPARETIWYTGHWEFQFYAENAGMHPIVAGESRLRPGDWLLVPEGVPKPPIPLPAEDFEPLETLEARSPSPWSTIPRFYNGPVGLRRQPETQLVLRVLRVTRDFVPELTVRRGEGD
jgi:hypothetical protein